MSKLSLKKGIQQYIDGIELTNEQLDDLMQIQKTSSSNELVIKSTKCSQ